MKLLGLQINSVPLPIDLPFEFFLVDESDGKLFGQKGQNHYCEISETTFYTFHVSPRLLLKLSKSFRSPQLIFFFNWNAKRMQCHKCSLANAIVFTNDFWCRVGRTATYSSMF